MRGRFPLLRPAMDWLDLLQWPAMAVTVAATGLVGAQSPQRREWGFWLFLLSNALWIAWGWHDAAWALVVLQVALIGMNVRGARKNDEAMEAMEESEGVGARP